MDTKDTRRELGRSVRLLADEERWLFFGLLGGAAGYLIWLAGTGVAVSQVAPLALGEVSTDPWSSDAAVLAAAFALLWVVVPSVVAVRYVVGNLTNLRGNVEQCYRFDRPLVALAPPLALLAVGVAVGALRGVATWYVLALLAVANTLLLVRAVAYGYRVYSFSTPRLLQGLLFVSAVVATTAAVTRASSLAGQTALVEAVAERYGVASVAFGTVTRDGLTAPALPLAAVATPAALALAYVWVQLFASLLVRIRNPEVPRSAVRAGQRYPRFVRPGTASRLAVGAGPTGTDGSGGGANDGSGGGANDGSGGGDASDEPSNPLAAGSGGDSSAGGPEAPGGDGPDDADSAEAVGQTRVFTPPDDDATGGENGGRSVDGAVKNEFCPICGETYAADEDRTNCPNCNAVLDRD